MLTLKSARVAVVGAGVSGAACARALAQAGHRVHLFDKSRGPGGRMATRRLTWADPLGQARVTPLDHGALAITARTPAFHSFVEAAVQAGCMARWSPRLAPDSLPLDSDAPWWVPVPDGPALCRHLLADAEVEATASWSCTVDRLQARGAGWQVGAGTDNHPQPFDAVVLALPPAQAAPLLQPHRSDWAHRAARVLMQPCWTLMGVAEAPTAQTAPRWQGDLCRPLAGPLAWVMRNDRRPGRQPVPGLAHWVVHAHAGWSHQHLEQPAAWVQQELQAALGQELGQPPKWLHCVVHRWRYALPPPAGDGAFPLCWWDADRRLGVCGDFLGGTGIEGAWLSAQALSDAMLPGPGAGGAAATPGPGGLA